MSQPVNYIPINDLLELDKQRKNSTANKVYSIDELIESDKALKKKGSTSNDGVQPLGNGLLTTPIENEGAFTNFKNQFGENVVEQDNGSKLAISPKTVPIPYANNKDGYVKELQQRIKQGIPTKQDEAVLHANRRLLSKYDEQDNTEFQSLQNKYKYVKPTPFEVGVGIPKPIEDIEVDKLSIDDKLDQLNNLTTEIKTQFKNFNGARPSEQVERQDELKKIDLLKSKLADEKVKSEVAPVYTALVQTNESGNLWNSLTNFTQSLIPNKETKALVDIVNENVVKETKLPAEFSIGLNKLKYIEPVEFERISRSLAKGEPISATQVATITNIGIDTKSKILKDSYAANEIDAVQYEKELENIQKQQTDNILGNKEVSRAYFSDQIANYLDDLKDNVSTDNELVKHIVGHTWNYTDDEIAGAAYAVAQANGFNPNDARIKETVKWLQDNEGAMIMQNSIAKAGWTRDLGKGLASPIRGIYNTVLDTGKDNAQIYAEGKSQGNTLVADKKLKRIEDNPIENAVSGVVEGLGQFATQAGLAALTSGAIGAAGKGLIAGAEATTAGEGIGAAADLGRGIMRSKDFVSTMATSYAQSYGQKLKQALTYTSDDATAKKVAIGLAALEGATENILSPLDVAKGIGKKLFNTKELSKGIIDILTDKNVLNKGADLKKLLFKSAWETTKVIGAEIGEEEVTQLADYGVNALLNKNSQSFQDRNLTNEMISTAYQTGLSMLIPALASGVGAFKVNNFSKGSLLVAAQNRLKLIDDMKKSLAEGDMTQDQFNEKSAIINTAAQANDAIPRNVKNEKLNTTEKANYIYSRVAESVLQKKIENSTDEAEINLLGAKVKEQQQYRSDILNLKPIYLVDNEVVDKSEFYKILKGKDVDNYDLSVENDEATQKELRKVGGKDIQVKDKTIAKKVEQPQNDVTTPEGKKAEIEKLNTEIRSFDEEHNRLADAVNAEDRRLNTPKSENEIKLNELQKKVQAIIDKRNQLEQELSSAEKKVVSPPIADEVVDLEEEVPPTPKATPLQDKLAAAREQAQTATTETEAVQPSIEKKPLSLSERLANVRKKSQEASAAEDLSAQQADARAKELSTPIPQTEQQQADEQATEELVFSKSSEVADRNAKELSLRSVIVTPQADAAILKMSKVKGKALGNTVIGVSQSHPKLFLQVVANKSRSKDAKKRSEKIYTKDVVEAALNMFPTKTVKNETNATTKTSEGEAISKPTEEVSIAETKPTETISETEKKVGTIYTNKEGKEKIIVQVNKDGSFLIKNNDGERQNPTLGDESDLKTKPTETLPKAEEQKVGNDIWKLTQDESFAKYEDKSTDNYDRDGNNTYQRIANNEIKRLQDGVSGLSIEHDKVVFRDENGIPIGYAKFTKDGIKNIGVLPESKGKGVATKMIEYLKKEKGIDNVLPNFSKEGNSLAHRNEVKKAIEKGLYQDAINKGELSRDKAIEIIKSAKLEVPKDISNPKEQPLSVEAPTKTETPIQEVVKYQIESFGVPKEDIEATHNLLGKVFDGLKKAGLTAAKTVGDWVGIGKGKENPYSLKIDGKDVQVKNVQPEVVNGFYSPLEKTINETKADKLPAKQWADKFRGEEAKWTGLKDWLNQQQGSVSKTDIQNYLKDNRIEIVEVVKGGEQKVHFNIKAEKGKSVVYKNGVKDKEFDTYDKADDYVTNYKESEVDATKFSKYQLEGEKENYKEVLVTMPVVSESAKNISEKYWEAAKARDEYKKQNAPRKQGEDIVAYIDRANAELKNDAKYQELTKNAEVLNKKMDDANKNQGEKFKSSHFDEPNILVHLRMNTRVDSDGKRVLFLEEVQSDFAQAGRKQGFKLTEQEAGKAWEEADKEYAKFMKRMESKYGSEWESEMEKAEVEEETKLLDARENTKGGTIPQAPFVTDTNSWTKLGLKVALKEAVKQGADKIAWTTGEQQNERYDLSKQVDKINYKKNENGTYDIVAVKGSESVFNQYNVKENELEGIVGKEVANKIVNSEGEKPTGAKIYTELKGNDLKVGGKGMKGFYGSPTEGSLGIVGNVAKSLYKQEPKTVKIRVDGYKNGTEYVDVNGDVVNPNINSKYSIQHSIDITPELKASVESGQPLFKDAEAQYRIESGKNIIEAIKDFNQSKNKARATVALTHEIMHPTVVSIIDGAKEGNEVGTKHTETIVSEFNKANPKNKVTVDELIKGNDDFKGGKTSEQYRAVQEFIAESWEKYHTEGGKGFSEAFQKVLDQITQAFKAVYKSISGKELTPELRKMFDEILGKESESVNAPIEEVKVEEPIEEKPSLAKIKSKVIEKSEESQKSAKKEGVSLKVQKDDLIGKIKEAMDIAMGENKEEYNAIDKKERESTPAYEKRIQSDATNRLKEAGFDIENEKVVFDIEGDGVFKLGINSLDIALSEVEKHWGRKIPERNDLGRSPKLRSIGKYDTIENAEQSKQDALDNLETAKKSGNKKQIELYEAQAKLESDKYKEAISTNKANKEQIKQIEERIKNGEIKSVYQLDDLFRLPELKNEVAVFEGTELTDEKPNYKLAKDILDKALLEEEAKREELRQSMFRANGKLKANSYKQQGEISNIDNKISGIKEKIKEVDKGLLEKKAIDEKRLPEIEINKNSVQLFKDIEAALSLQGNNNKKLAIEKLYSGKNSKYTEKQVKDAIEINKNFEKIVQDMQDNNLITKNCKT